MSNPENWREVRKEAHTVLGDGRQSVVFIQHGLATRDLSVTVYDIETYAEVPVIVTIIDQDRIQVRNAHLSYVLGYPQLVELRIPHAGFRVVLMG